MTSEELSLQFLPGWILCSRTGGKELLPIYGKIRKINVIKVMKRLKDKLNGKLVEITDVIRTPFGEGKATVSIGVTEDFGIELPDD